MENIMKTQNFSFVFPKGMPAMEKADLLVWACELWNNNIKCSTRAQKRLEYGEISKSDGEVPIPICSFFHFCYTERDVEQTRFAVAVAYLEAAFDATRRDDEELGPC